MTDRSAVEVMQKLREKHAQDNPDCSYGNRPHYVPPSAGMKGFYACQPPAREILAAYLYDWNQDGSSVFQGCVLIRDGKEEKPEVGERVVLYGDALLSPAFRVALRMTGGSSRRCTSTSESDTIVHVDS